MDKNRLAYTIIGIIILGILAYYAASYTSPSLHTSTSSLQAGYPVLVELTDPPQVPNGTQSLNILYSGVRVYFTSNSGISFIESPSSGTINLLSILNVSKTIANVSLPANSVINTLQFNISKASIQINGNVFPVALPNSTIAVHLAGAVRSSSSILADLSPTVITIITNTSAPLFVMVPSVKAVIVPGVNESAKVTGYAPLNATLKHVLSSSIPNISITSASLSTVGNTTAISITVKNNANESVRLRNVLVFGNESMNIYFNFTHGFSNISPMLPMRIPGPSLNGFSTNSTMPSNAFFTTNVTPTSLINNITPVFVANSVANALAKGLPSMLNRGGFFMNKSALEQMASEAAQMHGPVNGSQILGILRNITGNRSLTIPAIEHMNRTAIASLLNRTLISERIEKEHMHFRVVNFLIGSNASLLLPFSSLGAMNDYYHGGYLLSPGNTITLTYSGKMTIGNSRIILGFVKGDTYKVVVGGEQGASAFTNVTAS
ncbi:MAG: hypothetical protein ACP5TJ_03170 [Candidatus Micrarchaeia archaeon]